jgi:hypothetical protein
LKQEIAARKSAKLQHIANLRSERDSHIRAGLADSAAKAAAVDARLSRATNEYAQFAEVLGTPAAQHLKNVIKRRDEVMEFAEEHGLSYEDAVQEAEDAGYVVQ